MTMIYDDSEVELRPVTHAEMASFLTAHNVTPACPSCSHEGGAIHTRKGEQHLNILAMSTGNIVTNGELQVDDGRLSFAGVECPNCGFERLFSLAKVVSWLNSSKQ